MYSRLIQLLAAIPNQPYYFLLSQL